MKRRVLLVNTTFGRGGAGRVAADTWRALADHERLEVHYAFGRGRGPPSPRVHRVALVGEVLVHAALVRSLGLEGVGSPIATRRLLATVRRLRPAVVHLHNLHGYYVNFGALLRGLGAAGVPVLWTLHDEWAISSLRAHTMGCAHCRGGPGPCTSTYPYPRAYLPVGARSNLRRKRRATKHTNLTLVLPAGWLAESVASSFLGDVPRVVVPNGVDVEAFAPLPDRAAARRARGLPERGFIVAFAAEPPEHAAKGAAVIAAAAGGPWPGHDVAFVGIGPAPRAEGALRTMGYVRDRREVAALLGLADVFCCASIAETAPLSVLEAMACGLPVVGSDIPALRELVGPRAGILVPPNDPRALRSAILALLTDPERRAAAGGVARQRVSTSFDLRRFIDAHASLYERAARGF